MLPALVITASLAALARASPNPAATLTASPLPTLEVFPPLTPCAVVKCTANTTCVVIGGRATCQPNRPLPRQQCGSVLCATGTVCCNALCGICTPPGMMCVQGCAVKPSLPVLTLTPMVRKQSVEVKCGKNVCGEGEECCNSSCGICVKKGGFCTEQWCGPEDEVVEPPKATILPVERKGDKVKCGKNTCGEGEVCCNDSCGICTKKGGACTLQWCGPMPGEVEKPPKATLPVLPPKATFAPVGQKCGRNVCGAGQFCCNSSCSQCAPLGGGCTMQFCGHGTE